MTPAELRAFRTALGLSGAVFARLVGAADARSVRRWEAAGNDIPRSVVAMVRLLQWLPEDQRRDAVAWLLK